MDTFAKARLLYATSTEEVVTYEWEGRVLVVVAPGKFYRNTPQFTPEDMHTITRSLADTGKLYTMRGRVIVKIGEHWNLLSEAHVAQDTLSRLTVFVRSEEKNVQKWRLRQTDKEAFPNFWHTLAYTQEVEQVLEVPIKYARILATSHDRLGLKLPKTAGVLHHPIAPSKNPLFVERPWLIPAHESGTASPDYSVIKDLFRGLELDEDSHCALYTFLFGTFHEDSLYYPRPILVVDSWQQGRGKSEVCGVISKLVDDNDTAMSVPSEGRALEQIAAHTAVNRTLYLDNIDGRQNFHITSLDTLSTGVLNIRQKYERNSEPISGIVIMANLIYGAASFHKDMIDRTVRVELQGSSRALEPRPIEIATRKRHDLIAEILKAHEEADMAPFKGVESRFKEFERAGNAAYSVVFGVEPREVMERYERARRSSRGFYALAQANLVTQMPDLFRAVKPNVSYFDRELPIEIMEGARGLGHELEIREGSPVWNPYS